MYAGVGQAGRGPVWCAADGRDAESVLPSPRGIGYFEMSPDRRTLIGKFTLRQDDEGRDLWWWTVADTTPHRFTTGPANDYGARFSPDGKWVAYTADINGVRQAFVAAFPGPGVRMQLTQEGALNVVWGPDGKTVTRQVEVGAADLFHAQILSGLQEGENVLLSRPDEEES